MKYARLLLDAGGREAAVHPMYDLLTNAAYVDCATAIHWTFTGEEFSIMQYIEGEREPFCEALQAIPEIVAYEVVAASDNAFYAFIRDATTPPLQEVLRLLAQSPIVVLPPVEYTHRGTVVCRVCGPPGEIQTIIDQMPEPIDPSVEKLGSFDTVSRLYESGLSDRQQEAIETAYELGYYDLPRGATQADVAETIGCSPGTAAEHLQKAERKLVRSFLSERS